MKCACCHKEMNVSNDAYCHDCYEDNARAEFWSANNPLFVLLRISVVIVPLGLFLYANAASFDANERRVIYGMFMVLALGEGVWATLKKKLGG